MMTMPMIDACDDVAARHGPVCARVEGRVWSGGAGGRRPRLRGRRRLLQVRRRRAVRARHLAQPRLRRRRPALRRRLPSLARRSSPLNVGLEATPCILPAFTSRTCTSEERHIKGRAHATWHNLVFIGAALHFAAVCRHLLGPAALADSLLSTGVHQ